MPGGGRRDAAKTECSTVLKYVATSCARIKNDGQKISINLIEKSGFCLVAPKKSVSGLSLSADRRQKAAQSTSPNVPRRCQPALTIGPT
jgi:hypothetical protein